MNLFSQRIIKQKNISDHLPVRAFNAIVLILIIIFSTLILRADITPLPSLTIPKSLLVEKDKIYIVERFSISVYSLDDFTLIKKFGQEGEGPQEFKFSIKLAFHENNLIVTSLGKISYYDEFGKYIKERRTPDGFFFAGYSLPKNRFVSINNFMAPKRKYLIYDSNFSILKELCEGCSGYRQGDGFGSKALLRTYGDKIFIARGHEFAVDVFNGSGEKLYSIERKYKRIKFTSKHRDDFFNGIKADPSSRGLLPRIKKLSRFPDYFPAIRDIFISNNRIYIQTYKRSNRENEFFIFDTEGEFIKKLFLPIYEGSGGFNFSAPYTIHNEKIYQLIENEESYIWELHTTKIPFS